METSRNNTHHILARIGPGNQGIVAVVGNFKAEYQFTCTFVLCSAGVELVGIERYGAGFGGYA